jgi:limonene-1,2-epoxide hydrolase
MSSFTWGQSMDNMNNQEKTRHFFKELNKDNMHLVDIFYHQEVKFQDPVETINGTKNIKKYYENMYQNVKSIKFDFTSFIESEDTIVAIWTMTLVTDALNGGGPVVVDGNSVIKFTNGKAIYHRDYFDMGAFIYENIPVLGFLVKKVKERLKVKECLGSSLSSL